MREILCYGDSNTYGLIPGTKDRFDYDIRWTGILDKKLRKQNIHVVEEGLCGRTTVFDDPDRIGRNGLELLPTILEMHAPADMVVLMIGTNDCKAAYRASAEEIGAGIRKMIRQIKVFSRETQILLIAPILLGKDIWDGYDMDFDATSVEVSAQLGDIYERIAFEEDVYFLKASDYAEASPDDREHLDAEGHLLLAEKIYQIIMKDTCFVFQNRKMVSGW